MRPSMRNHRHRRLKSNALAFLVTVLLLFMVLIYHQMSSNFLLWLVVGAFLMASSRRMYAKCQQLQAQARAHAAASSGLLGRTELRVHMPPPIAFATRGRYRTYYDTLRTLNSETIYLCTIHSMSEEEINSLPVHQYKVSESQGVDSSQQNGSSSSNSPEMAMQESRAGDVGTKPLDDELTCSICLEQVSRGELVRSMPCFHQFHANCIDTWLRQQGTCLCVNSSWEQLFLIAGTNHTWFRHSTYFIHREILYCIYKPIRLLSIKTISQAEFNS